MIHQIYNSLGNYNYNGFLYTDREWEMHFHRGYELIYAFRGTSKVSSGGVHFEVNAGEFLLVPPNSPHSLDIPDTSSVWVGVFSKEFIASFRGKIDGMIYAPFRCEEPIEAYLKEYLLFEGTPESHMISSCLIAVCGECIKKAVLRCERQENDVGNAILRYVSDNFRSKLTLADVAEALGYDYHYISKLFHKSFEMNFKEFLNILRYENACELLCTTDKSITEIALESGFQSIRNFNRVFKSLDGEVPKARQFTGVRDKV